MAANPGGMPTPGTPADHDHRLCPVCLARPCAEACWVGFGRRDMEEWDDLLAECDPPAGPDDDFLPPRDWDPDEDDE